MIVHLSNKSLVVDVGKVIDDLLQHVRQCQGLDVPVMIVHLISPSPHGSSRRPPPQAEDGRHPPQTRGVDLLMVYHKQEMLVVHRVVYRRKQGIAADHPVAYHNQVHLPHGSPLL
jgi:hypothetical protein